MNNQIRKGRKFEQVLAGARDVFMKDGFEGASVDDIARTAGVSKATLYSYFPDKRLLFVEVAQCECLRQAENYVSELPADAKPRDVLYGAGRQIIRFMTSDMGKNVVRMCASESMRFPDLGRRFYESGPGLVRRHLCDYLTKANDDGLLDIDDPLLAADLFAEMCKARIFPMMMCCVQTEFSEEELDTILKAAVDMFMARYGT
ncbi:TetR/AcrR family transcriptional regulator [Actibacterium ureilyticum]|uniref:TetR/AcrR family transcriptional regulator n=1 Tax=Actibacterium ureilyticum TaxID=1590614 RepID=UPI000BAAC9DA|nr:TetR/AcrR family transcriptional regulator [Actibacterium ureilyticum]